MSKLFITISCYFAHYLKCNLRFYSVIVSLLVVCMNTISFIFIPVGPFPLFVAAVTDRPRRYYYSFISSYMITLSGFLAGTFFSVSFSQLSPPLSGCITAGLVGTRQAASPGRANLHKSFHSGYPLQTPLYNICLHLRVHRPSHLLFLCSPPSSLPPRFVNLIKAAIKQRFICLGPNLPYRRHVTTYAAHTCRMCSQPRLSPPHTAHSTCSWHINPLHVSDGRHARTHCWHFLYKYIYGLVVCFVKR